MIIVFVAVRAVVITSLVIVVFDDPHRWRLPCGIGYRAPRSVRVTTRCRQTRSPRKEEDPPQPHPTTTARLPPGPGGHLIIFLLFFLLQPAAPRHARDGDRRPRQRRKITFYSCVARGWRGSGAHSECNKLCARAPPPPGVARARGACPSQTDDEHLGARGDPRALRHGGGC